MYLTLFRRNGPQIMGGGGQNHIPVLSPNIGESVPPSPLELTGGWFQGPTLIMLMSTVYPNIACVVVIPPSYWKMLPPPP